MDKFLVYALTLLFVISFAIMVASYIGHKMGYSLEGADDVVENMAVSHSHAKPTEVLPAIPEHLEPVGFTLAGVVGGLLVGYFWEDIFREGS